MNAYQELRDAARAKRDAAIRLARDDYAETLKRIAQVEQDITGSVPSDHKSIAQSVRDVIPYDRTFTSVDLLAALEAMEPHRIWRKDSVVTRLTVLQQKGVIKRIKRAKGSEPAVYALTHLEVDKGPFGDLSLEEVLVSMLKDRMPMTQTELVVLMLEEGYETAMSKPMLRNTVGTMMRQHPERFTKHAHNKWSLR